MSYTRAVAYRHASRVYHWSPLGHDAVVGETGERSPARNVLTHFANYIPVGARTLEAIPGDAGVLVLAFLLPDGGVSTILVNPA